ncbi:MAG: hypothetical protein O3C21_08490 [Verrucomicrobia bacterium]|nr:hypothetical protein [Verrucomicrobiota bacterium]
MNNNRIASLAPLAGLAAPESLDIDSNYVTDVSPLHGLGSLSVLDIHANRVSDFTPLLRMARLDYVDLRLNGLDVDSNGVRAMLEGLSDEFYVGAVRPQFLPTLTTTFDCEQNLVVITWPAEKDVFYWVEASPATANTSTSTAADLRDWTVLSFGGGSPEMRHEFTTDTGYRWIRVVPYLPVQ